MKPSRHITYAGLPLYLQALPGERHAGNRKMIGASYGRIMYTNHQAADGMNLDVFLASHPRGDTAYVIDIADDHDVFQESKIMLGFTSPHAAIDVFRRTYGRDHDHHVAAITPLSLDELKEWINSGGGKEPVSECEPDGEHGGDEYQEGGAVGQAELTPADFYGELLPTAHHLFGEGVSDVMKYGGVVPRSSSA